MSGRITGASHVARNITQRKRIDERFQHLAAIVDSSDDAIISKTLKGVILTWNAGAERLYGYSAADAIGRQMTMLLPEDRPDEENEILARISRGERVEHYETVRRTKSGESIDVSLTISPTRDMSGRITGASHVARDISERKKSEMQREQVIKELRDALRQVRTLQGLIPICAWCKKIRNDKGYWQQLEAYISEHSEADFSHGMCPDCVKNQST
jgi:PAS domain S-box-containing protein